MAFDYTGAIQMTKALSVLIADNSDGQVQDMLDQYALPKIRLFLLTATDQNGQNVLYNSMAELSDTGAASAVEAVIDLLMEEQTVKGAIRKIAAQYAAAGLIVAQFGVMDSQQKVGTLLEKEGTRDLEKLVKSPLMRGAVASATTKVSATGNIASINPTLYLALDGDETTKDATFKTVQPYAGAQLPYAGAPEAGRLGLILNGFAVEVTIAEGTEPIAALNQLLTAFEAAPGRPNVSLAINERTGMSGSLRYSYNDPLSGDPTTGDFILTTPGASMTLLPRNYEADLDVAVATLYLQSRKSSSEPTVWVNGLAGYRYGISSRVNELTLQGPHAIAADLQQGKAVSLGGSGSSGTGPDEAVSDSFFFRIEDPSGVTTDDGSLVYQVNAMSVKTVPVPAGSTPLEVAALLAQSLADNAADQRVLGAVRPSATVTLNGTVLQYPSLEMVAFGVETGISNIVVRLKSVPPGVDFALVGPTTLTAAYFDAYEKSVVIQTVLNKPKATTGTSNDGTGTESTGDSLIYDYVPSASLQKILTNFKKYR